MAAADTAAVEGVAVHGTPLPSAAPSRVELPPSVHLALVIIAVVVAVYALQWAQIFFIPLALSVFIESSIASG